MAYIMIEDYSCVWPTGPTALDPKGFAIHWWGSGTPQFMPIVQLLVNRAAQGSASVTFVAEEGQVACLTSPFEVAWGQGDGANGWGNRNLVSIECNPRCSAGDRETVAELIADQHIKNGIPINLYPHNKFTATQCPGVWEQWIPWLTKRANEIVVEKRNGSFGNGEEEMALSDADIDRIADRVLNKDIAWYGFTGTPTENRKTTTLALQVGWLDTQFNAAYGLVREASTAIQSVLTALKELPDIDDEVISNLKTQLEEQLKAATENLRVTLEVPKAE